MRKEMFLTGEEMFEELKAEGADKYLNFMDPAFKEFVVKCYDHAGVSIEDIEYENKVCEIMIDHLIRGGFLNKSGKQIFVDLLLVSAFLHSLYINENDLITTMVKPRIEFLPIAESLDMPEQYTDAIFEAIESQFGPATPIRACKPGANTPQEVLAESIFIARNLYKWCK